MDIPRQHGNLNRTVSIFHDHDKCHQVKAEVRIQNTKAHMLQHRHVLRKHTIPGRLQSHSFHAIVIFTTCKPEEDSSPKNAYMCTSNINLAVQLQFPFAQLETA
jgi:hypothetical protein